MHGSYHSDACVDIFSLSPFLWGSNKLSYCNEKQESGTGFRPNAVLVDHTLWGSSYIRLGFGSTKNVSLAAGGEHNGSTVNVWSTSIESFSWLEPSVSFSSVMSVLCKHVRIDGHQSFFLFSFLLSASSLVWKLSLKRKKYVYSASLSQSSPLPLSF